MTFEHFDVFYGQTLTQDQLVQWLKFMKFSEVYDEIMQIEKDFAEDDNQYDERMSEYLNELGFGTELTYDNRLLKFDVREFPHDQLPKNCKVPMFVVGINIGRLQGGVKDPAQIAMKPRIISTKRPCNSDDYAVDSDGCCKQDYDLNRNQNYEGTFAALGKYYTNPPDLSRYDLLNCKVHFVQNDCHCCS